MTQGVKNNIHIYKKIWPNMSSKAQNVHKFPNLPQNTKKYITNI